MRLCARFGWHALLLLLASCGGKIAASSATLPDAASDQGAGVPGVDAAVAESSVPVGPEPCGDAGTRLETIAAWVTDPPPTACSDGDRPQMLADGASAFDVDATFVYWIAPVAAGAMVYRREKRCGAPAERIASLADTSTQTWYDSDLRIRREDLLWSLRGGPVVYRVDRSAGAVLWLFAGDGEAYPDQVVVDGADRIFYTVDLPSPQAHGVALLDGARCASRYVSTTAKWPAPEIAVDDTDLYLCTNRYGNSYVLQRQPKLAAPAVVADDAPTLGSCGAHFTGDADHLAWVETTWTDAATPTYHVYVYRKSDGSGGIVWSNTAEPSSLTLSGDSVYAAYDTGISRVPIAGGPKSTVARTAGWLGAYLLMPTI